ncbi:MAG: transglutaminase family protein [Candidatus Kryptoniota bacterium]
MPIFKIHHITKYEYDRPVRESVNEIKLYPYSSPVQEVLHHELVITGSPPVFHYLDYWGNRSGVFNLLGPHREIQIDSRFVVRTIRNSIEKIPFDSYRKDILDASKNNLALLELSAPKPLKKTAVMNKLVAQIFDPDKSIAQTIKDCSELVNTTFEYHKGITDIQTTVDELLEQKAGVCQDFANITLELLRMAGIPCRYASGYVCPNKKGLRGEGATHAWVEAFIPGHGWTGIDPTNNVWVTDKHVKLAVGKDFAECTPVKGTFKGPARESLSVYVSIGYEDGQQFDDLTQVKLSKGMASPEIDVESFAGQQQQ